MLQRRSMSSLHNPFDEDHVADDSEVVRLDESSLPSLGQAPMIFLETDGQAGTVPHGPAEDKTSLTAILTVLRSAHESEEALSSGDDNTETAHSSPAAAALEEIEGALDANATAEALDKLIQGKYHDVIQAAFELLSEGMDVDQAKKAGDLVTADMLTELNGLPDSPEQSTLNNTVQFDMVAENASAAALLQVDMAAGRRWGGQLFPTGEPITYCFASD